MCNTYKVCGKRHLPKWKLSKKLRNRKGQFNKDRRLVKIFMTVVGMYGLSLIGVNTIWNWAKSLEKTFVVENSKAGDVIDNLTLEEKVYATAKQFKINGYQMYRTIVCETNLRNIQSEIRDLNGPNGREDSWGYFQINLPSWPEVSKLEALDEDFSIRWAAEHWYKAKWYGYNRKIDKCIK